MARYRVAWAYGVNGSMEYGCSVVIPMDADERVVELAEQECRLRLEEEGAYAISTGTRVMDAEPREQQAEDDA